MYFAKLGFFAFGFIVLTIIGAADVRAHCQAVFVKQAPAAVSYQYKPGRGSSTRTTHDAFSARFEARFGAPPTESGADQYERHQDEFLSEFSGNDEQQTRLLFEIEYLNALRRENRTAEILQRLAMLEVTKVLPDRSSLARTYDDGDFEGAFSVGFLAGHIRLIEHYAILEQNREFNEVYAERLHQMLLEKDGYEYAASDRRIHQSLPPPEAKPETYAAAVSFGRSLKEKEHWQRLSEIAPYSVVLGIETSTVDDRLDIYLDANGVKILRVGFDGRPPVLLAGWRCHHEYLENHRSLAAKRETDDFVLASVLLNDEGNYTVLVGSRYEFLRERDHFVVTSEELAQMKAGVAASQRDSELSAFMSYLRQSNKALVLASHPMMQKDGRHRDAAHRFVDALERAYPHGEIVIDAPIEQLGSYVSRFRRYTAASEDLAVVLDVGRFGVDLQEDFFEAAPRWRKTLGEHSVIFYTKDMPEQNSRPKNVIIITGRTNEDLRNFVRELGEKGYIDDNYVVLESCGEPLSTELVAEINGRFSAAGTFHYRGRIHPEDALEHTEKIIESISHAVPKTVFSRAVLDSLRIRQSLNKLPMEGFWTICEAAPWGSQHG